MSFPDTEQKFLCPHCDYRAIVAGKRYYENELELFLETRSCNDCNRLFDNIVTEKATDEAKKVQIDKFHIDFPDSLKDPFGESLTHFGDYLSKVKCEELNEVRCTWCGSSNNETWVDEKPVCPQCQSLMTPVDYNYKKDLTYEKFSDFREIINSASKVILCFGFSECSSCRHTRHIMQEIIKDNPNEFQFIEIDIEYVETNGLIRKYNLKYAPTFLLFNNGKFIGKFRNFSTKSDLIRKITKRFSKN